MDMLQRIKNLTEKLLRDGFKEYEEGLEGI